jgi:hypothetical protein
MPKGSLGAQPVFANIIVLVASGGGVVLSALQTVKSLAAMCRFQHIANSCVLPAAPEPVA